ncbi:MAG TPA: iron-containing redox enzyme family protein [Polyangiales bacterium]|nr:iron-containing redox enzyme family protein [Polyangiales bacterium]
MPLDAFLPEPIQKGLDSSNAHQLHSRLCDLNRARTRPTTDASRWESALDEELRLRRIEHRYVEEMREVVRARAECAPTTPDAFVAWFEDLKKTGPGQADPLFPWLEHSASFDQLRWFLTQEMAGEAGFEDLVAWTQVKLPAQAKLELARNYWDEMGQGTLGGMHGPMLEQLGHALDLTVTVEGTVWESLALGNLMSALGANRHYTYQSVGALGVIELTAPGRAVCVNAGMKRLGVAGSARRYYALHATLDIKHSAAWNREVLRPLVDSDPRIATAIAEGALMRLLAGERCFVRYRQQLMP